MRVTLVVCALIFQFCRTSSLYIPDQLPLLLSVIFSNIPTIKKGTDSRVGWGFRLGDRVDFQTLTEFGPQTYTQPLANQNYVPRNKRNVPKDPQDLKMQIMKVQITKEGEFVKSQNILQNVQDVLNLSPEITKVFLEEPIFKMKQLNKNSIFQVQPLPQQTDTRIST